MKKSDWRSPRTLRMWIALSLALVIQSPGAARSEQNARRIRTVVNGLKKQLGITAEIRTAVVAKNDLVVSVQPLREQEGAFEISFEEGFLNMLDDQDLRAVIAHELGHVWIFTHHPYLQTEDLANSIAYRAVTEEALDRLYEKLRVRQGLNSRLAASVRPTQGLHQ